MAKIKYIVSLSLFIGLFNLDGSAQNTLSNAISIDSNYRNWYYDSREDLYNKLGHLKYDVIFFGNSITERGDWQELFGNKLAIGNRGIGGDNSFGLKARTVGITKLKPKKLFIMIGINDIGRGLPTDVILNNCRQIIESIRKNSSKTKIYLQSALPLNESILKYDYLKGKSQQINELNIGLQKVAKEEHLVFIDLHPLFSSEKDVLNPIYTSDGIHLLPRAYTLWVDYLKEKKYL